MDRTTFGESKASEKLVEVLKNHDANTKRIISKHLTWYNFGLKQIGGIEDYRFRLRMANDWRNSMIKAFEEKELIKKERVHKKVNDDLPTIETLCKNLMVKRYREHRKEWKESE